MLRYFLPVFADVVPSAVILLLGLLIWFYFAKKNGKTYTLAQKLGIVLFIVYLLAVCSKVGIPSIKYMHLDFSINLLPLVDMLEEPVRSTVLNLLNVLMFVPLGLLLPAVWPYYRSWRRMILTGFNFSLSIELLQLFSWRLTDIDDLLTNTLGAVLGYGLFRLIYLLLKKEPPAIGGDINWEPWLIWLACLLITILVVPFLPEAVRNWFLYTPFWQGTH